MIARNQDEIQNQIDVPLRDQRAKIFKSFEMVDRGQRKPNQKQVFANEWDTFKAGIPCPPEQDPLDWWRRKENEFPCLGVHLIVLLLTLIFPFSFSS